MYTRPVGKVLVDASFGESGARIRWVFSQPIYSSFAAMLATGSHANGFPLRSHQLTEAALATKPVYMPILTPFH